MQTIKRESMVPDQLPRHGTNVQIKLNPFSLVVIAGLGELIGADAIFLCCACGAGLGVASLSASYPVAPAFFPVAPLTREHHQGHLQSRAEASGAVQRMQPRHSTKEPTSTSRSKSESFPATASLTL
jgi:hypothetical protein